MSIYILPHLQAIFNATTACLLTAGYILIRKRYKTAHKTCMIATVMVSVLCTVSYLTFHFSAGTVKFQGTGISRKVFFFILGSHSFLALATVPLVILTIYLAFKGKFDRHKKIARWALPIWIYVSITGVTFYWMHYHFHQNYFVP